MAVRIIVLIFVLAAFFFGVAGWQAYSNIVSIRQDSERVSYTHNVISGLGQLLIEVLSLELLIHEYPNTGEAEYLKHFEPSYSRIEEIKSNIESLLKDKEQLADFRRWKPLSRPG